jgi:predicted ArsR family transcriptional regulator
MDTTRGGLTVQLQPTRRKILLALKKAGGLTAGELGDLLGMTSMGVRRHLNTLERDGLVSFDSRQSGLGRPSYVYQLSAQGENLFPRNYHVLANELLGYLDEAELARVFERQAQRRVRLGRARLAGLSFPAKVAELARILDEDGYLAEWEQVDPRTFVVREFNCAIHEVAYRYRQACAQELEFMRALLLEAEVVREEYMMSGGSVCSYRITERA